MYGGRDIPRNVSGSSILPTPESEEPVFCSPDSPAKKIFRDARDGTGTEVDRKERYPKDLLSAMTVLHGEVMGGYRGRVEYGSKPEKSENNYSGSLLCRSKHKRAGNGGKPKDDPEDPEDEGYRNG